jgi:uncharacterized protein (TIGR03086 family)
MSSSLHELDFGLRELRQAVATLDDAEMDITSNCEEWTVRRLASHALNNQLFWAGLAAAQPLVSFEDAMGAVPIEGDLALVADDVVMRAAALWRTDGIADAVHATPLGELPGSAVIYFAIIDALAHAWDLSTSVGRQIEFDASAIPWISEVVATTCTDGARDHGLIKPPTEPPTDSTETERLMALAGRSIAR